MVEKLWRYVKPFSYNTSVSRTGRQTDRQTDIITISISRVSSSMLTRDKKRDKNALYTSTTYILTYLLAYLRCGFELYKCPLVITVFLINRASKIWAAAGRPSRIKHGGIIVLMYGTHVSSTGYSSSSSPATSSAWDAASPAFINEINFVLRSNASRGNRMTGKRDVLSLTVQWKRLIL